LADQSFTDVSILWTIIPSVETSQKIVALTFDDGPTPNGTNQILAILAEENVKATFFVTGAELEPEFSPRQKDRRRRP
jgi:peptidoglycan-N-acetylglucosamine deacetylase